MQLGPPEGLALAPLVTGLSQARCLISNYYSNKITQMTYPVDSGSSICGDFAEFRRGISGRPMSRAGVNHSRSIPLDKRYKLLFLQKFRRCIAPSIFAFAFRRRVLALQAGDFSKHNI